MPHLIYRKLAMSGSNRTTHTRFWMAWAISFGIATILVLTDAGQDYIRITMNGNSTPNLGRIILWPSIWWCSWAVLAAGVYLLSRRYNITRDSWRTSIPIHIAANIAVYALHVAMQIASMSLPAYQTTHDSWGEAIAYHVTSSIFLNVLIYWSIVGASHAFIFYTRYRQREVQTAQLESELHKAQLNTLKMQLQPHFLFNTLHAISSLMYRDVDAADRMIAKLGELLRSTIEMTGINEVPLHEELLFIRNYLEIEQARFRDRLVVTFEIAEDVRHAIVPNLILQPIVENAVKHGIAHTTTKGRMEIKAWKEGDWLLLYVADNGPGIAGGDSLPGRGTGLTNTQQRLATLYRSNHAMNFRPNAPSGLVVELSLPLRCEEDPREPETMQTFDAG